MGLFTKKKPSASSPTTTTEPSHLAQALQNQQQQLTLAELNQLIPSKPKQAEKLLTALAQQYSETALHMALRYGQSQDIVERLIQVLGQEQDDDEDDAAALQVPNIHGELPVHIAARHLDETNAERNIAILRRLSTSLTMESRQGLLPVHIILDALFQKLIAPNRPRTLQVTIYLDAAKWILETRREILQSTDLVGDSVWHYLARIAAVAPSVTPVSNVLQNLVARTPAALVEPWREGNFCNVTPWTQFQQYGAKMADFKKRRFLLASTLSNWEVAVIPDKETAAPKSNTTSSSVLSSESSPSAVPVCLKAAPSIPADTSPTEITLKESSWQGGPGVSVEKVASKSSATSPSKNGTRPLRLKAAPPLLQKSPRPTADTATNESSSSEQCQKEIALDKAEPAAAAAAAAAVPTTISDPVSSLNGDRPLRLKAAPPLQQGSPTAGKPKSISCPVSSPNGTRPLRLKVAPPPQKDAPARYTPPPEIATIKSPKQSKEDNGLVVGVSSKPKSISSTTSPKSPRNGTRRSRRKATAKSFPADYNPPPAANELLMQADNAGSTLSSPSDAPPLCLKAAPPL